ncbi:NADH-quinone oxidoreductase subunit D [Folsomia candida]|uniref:NADH-quinone oxidoreductase subunit D n=1 Tax=Folsomia candida TaxID=158441 RepID=A0A226E9C3_FOLCA|nr:NADH-quinone oxidoreductase subunit D [Folsomia candida]
MKHIILFLYTVATVTQGVLGARDQCNSTVPCPLSNGYQMDCKYEFGGGIGCACKRCFCPGNTQQFTYHGCVPRPKIGESCGYQNVTVGCLTSRAICTVESGNTCQCISMHVDDPPHYPSHDLERCIPKPVLLDQPCSIAAPCDNIPGAVCGVAHQCACASDSYPHEDGSAIRVTEFHTQNASRDKMGTFRFLPTFRRVNAVRSTKSHTLEKQTDVSQPRLASLAVIKRPIVTLFMAPGVTEVKPDRCVCAPRVYQI